MTRLRVWVFLIAAFGGVLLLPAFVTSFVRIREGKPGVLALSQVKSPTLTFTVNSTADTTDGTCNGANCTLREAIAAANNNPGPDSIVFDIGSGTPSIAVAGSALPTITDAVTIDGNTGGATRVELNGIALMGGGSSGLVITAGNCTIRGLVINRFGTQGIALSAGSGNVIQGNFIGTNAAGTAASGNGESGILISNSTNNMIGGTSPAERNIISGNLLHGVLIFGSTTSGNVVEGNYIGLNAAGTGAIGNVGEGISILGAFDNTIGGLTAGSRNVISGNGNKGIRISDLTTSDNVIVGNYIGTNAAGTGAVPNQSDGLEISFSALDNTIGGNSPEARNVISGNSVHGIRIVASGSGNRIQGNLIGIKADGITALQNILDGIFIGFGSNNTLIGGSGPGEGNRIAFNGSVGVNVADGTGNSVLSNELFSNGGLGINLGPAGVTPNDTGDPDTGANNLQNFPIVTSATTLAGGGVRIQGTLNSTASTSFTLQFFSNSNCDPIGNGEGTALVGEQVVATDGTGNVAFSIDFPITVPPGSLITSTATNPQGSTSEFSPCVTSVGLADLSLIKTAPSPVTAGSNLTYSIMVANNGPNPASPVVITDNLPVGLTFVSCNSTSGGVCSGSGNNRTVTLPSLGSGGTAIVTIVAQVNCSLANGSSVSNTATVSSPLTDPNTSNNSSTISTGVSNPPATLDPPSRAFAADGGPGEVMVFLESSCSWTAVSNDTWITVTTGSSGAGNGIVAYSVAVNGTGIPRIGTITIAGQTFTVNQSNVFCTFSILPTNSSFPVNGGTGKVSVTTQSPCIWKPVSNDSWISIIKGSGIGSDDFSYVVDLNPGINPRTGTISVAGLIFTINQAGGCADFVSPTTRSVNAAGAATTLDVVAPGGCNWTANTTASWIQITSGASGNGNGTVGYTVAENRSERARSGVITVAGWAHTVFQHGIGQQGCNILIKPKSRSFGASGGSADVAIRGSVACVWSASTSENWITITSNSNGIGAGTLTYTVLPNPGAARVGIIDISGKTHTVKQKGS